MKEGSSTPPEWFLGFHEASRRSGHRNICTHIGCVFIILWSHIVLIIQTMAYGTRILAESRIDVAIKRQVGSSNTILLIFVMRRRIKDIIMMKGDFMLADVER